MHFLEFLCGEHPQSAHARAMPGYVRAGQEFLACRAGVGVASIGDIQRCASPRGSRPSRALLALVNGKWVVLRVPYPLSFYAKGMDGRIDDPNAGWKGRGVWTTSGDRVPWLKEGGKGSDRLPFPAAPQPARRLKARAAGPHQK